MICSDDLLVKPQMRASEDGQPLVQEVSLTGHVNTSLKLWKEIPLEHNTFSVASPVLWCTIFDFQKSGMCLTTEHSNEIINDCQILLCSARGRLC